MLIKQFVKFKKNSIMKSKMIKIAFVVAIAFVSGINVFNAQKLAVLSDVAMENVEALAIPEWGDGGTYFCIGSGKVDCYDGTKVERQDSFMSLGDEYETE